MHYQSYFALYLRFTLRIAACLVELVRYMKLCLEVTIDSYKFRGLENKVNLCTVPINSEQKSSVNMLKNGIKDFITSRLKLFVAATRDKSPSI